MANKGARDPTERERIIISAIAKAINEDKLFIGDGVDPKSGETMLCVCIQRTETEDGIVTAPLCLIPQETFWNRFQPTGGGIVPAGVTDHEALLKKAAAEARSEPAQPKGLRVVGGKDTLH